MAPRITDLTPAVIVVAPALRSSFRQHEDAAVLTTSRTESELPRAVERRTPDATAQLGQPRLKVSKRHARGRTRFPERKGVAASEVESLGSRLTERREVFEVVLGVDRAKRDS
jgi:hypothetical protein